MRMFAKLFLLNGNWANKKEKKSMEKKSVFIIDNSKESSNELLKALSLEQDL